MHAEPSRFQESNLWSTPIRDLGLRIEGTRLEPILAEFERELRNVGITRLKPRWYLSTEWGVPFETIAIAIPFYLARPDLTALHAEKVGHIEGFNRADILRYLRHEMGHVVNYAYRLYDDEEWVKHFGSITQPYSEEYSPEPFSRRYVRHLPGWYAQKHPDEDWSETFAVWMTPGLDWRSEYGGWPIAYAKLSYVSRTMHALHNREPEVTATDLDEDVGEIEYSLGQYYGREVGGAGDLPPGLDGALRAIFDDLSGSDGQAPAQSLKPALRARADGKRIPLDRPLSRANPSSASLPRRTCDSSRARLPGAPRGRRDYRTYHAGHWTGDESCTAGKLSAVTYFPYRSSVRFMIFSIRRG
jgi:hypothetical protein